MANGYSRKLNVIAREGREDADGLSGLGAAFGMRPVVRQLRRTGHVHPLALSRHIQPRFVKRGHRGPRQRLLNLLFRLRQSCRTFSESCR